MMRSTLLATILALLVSHPAGAATWLTAVYGVDSATCGSKAAPCRSISQAIANAAAGDTVLVGPGFYGDVNGNHSFADPGDEAAEGGGGCDCMVNVSKAVTVKSRDGANVTVIGANHDSASALAVTASGATVGGPQNGFTLRDASQHGLHVGGSANDVHVIGNVADSNAAAGFQIDGDGAVLTGNRAFQNVGDGFDVIGSGIVASGDVASANAQSGFVVLNGQAEFSKSMASGNAQYGFAAVTAGMTLSGVTAAGNGLAGVLYVVSATGAVNLSTLLGNGFADGGHCGVSNQAGVTIDATNDYWGDLGGPGAGAADLACVDGGGSVLTTTPFKTKELPVALKPMR
jgi:parallel beta helix pectate lyase-like protein/uncharacterized protein DUF1565